MKQFQWVSETELEPLQESDAQLIRMCQGALFRNTTLPSGAVTPDEDMIVKGGVLVKVSAVEQNLPHDDDWEW